MKRLLIGLAPLFALVATGIPWGTAAGAATIDARTFATSPRYCGNQYGAYTVHGLLVVNGGAATLGPQGCIVQLAPNAELRLVNVRLTTPSGGPFLVVDGDHAILRVLGSELSSGQLWLLPGTDPGQNDPLTPENYALLDVEKSALSGGVILQASERWWDKGGHVKVVDSRIVGVGSIAASDESNNGVSGGHGLVEVSRNSVGSGGQFPVTIVTGKAGTTKVIENRFTSPATIHGETCQSLRNLPTIPCS